MAVDPERGDHFFGRQAELGRLEAALDRAGAGKPQLVLVVGEQGIGKSALIRHFARAAASRDASVHRAQCQPLDEGAAYSLVSGLLLSLLRLSRQSTPSAMAISLVQAAGPGADGRQRAALLGHLLGVEAKDAAVRSLSPQQLRTGAFAALNDLVTFRASSGLVMLAAADLQWADAASLDWLTSLLDRLLTSDEPLRLVITCETRPDQRLRIRHGGDAFELLPIQLGPLSKAQTAECAAALLGAGRDALPPGAAEALDRSVMRSRGNPAFLNQLLAAEIESGALAREGITGEAPDEGASPGAEGSLLPSSVQAAVRARMDALPGPLLRLVQLAATLGRELDRHMLGRLNGNATPAQIEELLHAGILLEEEGRLAFRQAEFHDVAYGLVPPSLRKVLHLRVAEAIEASGAEGEGTVRISPNLLAHHFARAQDAPRAAKYLAEAGDRARDLGDSGRARECYQAALSWSSRAPEGAGALPTADVMLHLAIVAGDLGDLDGALDLLERRSEQAGESARSLRARAEIHRLQGDLDQALENLDAALEHGGEAPERALCLAAKSDVLRLAGKFKDAITLAKEALAALASQERKQATDAYVHSVLGICHHRLGNLSVARLEHATALKLRESAGDLAGCAASLNNIATIDAQQGRWDQAQAGYKQSLDLARRLGDQRSLVLALENIGDLLMNRGEDESAEFHFRESVRISREIGAVGDEIIGIANLAMLRLGRHDGPGALQEIEACWSLCELSGHAEYAADLLNIKGRAQHLVGDHGMARRNLERARGLAERSGHTALVAIVDRSLAEIDAAEGKPAEAFGRARQSEEALRKATVPLELGRTLAVLARVAPPAEREAFRTEAAKLFKSLGARHDLERLQGEEVPGLDRTAT